MTNSPLVSVIIPCYNAEKYVESAVRSIMNQTYKNLEIILTDDCSTDGTFAILEKLAVEDSRIKLYKNETNLKIVKTLNKMVQLASGKYIARMDSDDISLPKRIEKQVKFLEKHSDCDICGCNIYKINSRGKTFGKTLFPVSYTDNKYFSKFSPTLCHPTIIARKEVFAFNLYDESFNFAEDYELWVRLQYKFNKNISNINKKLFKYRIFPEQTSQFHKNEQSNKDLEIFKKYKIIDEADLDPHWEIFFSGNTNSGKTSLYAKKILNELKNKHEFELAVQTTARMIYFFIHKENKIPFYCIFNRFGLCAVLRGTFHKIRKLIMN